MPSLLPKSFSFAAAYVGDASPASAVLTRIGNIRTEGTDVIDNTPTDYLPWLDEVVVTGLRDVTVEMQFYESSSDLVDKLAMGISVSGSFADGPSLQKYALLLVAPEASPGRLNFYFPKLRSEVHYESKFVKDGAVVVPVTFKISANELDTLPYYRSTLVNLATSMGARSPL